MNSSGLAKPFHLFKNMHCVECYDVDPPKENFGWQYALRYISEELRIKKNISIIVDSDLATYLITTLGGSRFIESFIFRMA